MPVISNNLLLTKIGRKFVIEQLRINRQGQVKRPEKLLRKTQEAIRRLSEW